MSGNKSVCFILQCVNIFLRVKYLTERLEREKASLLHRGCKFKDVFKYIFVC